MKRAIFFAITIIIAISLVGYLNSNKPWDERDILKAIKRNQKNAITDSLVIKSLSNNKKLIFIEDYEYAYAYYLDGENLELKNFVLKFTTTDRPLDWSYTSTTPHIKPSMLLGVFDDTVIKKVKVNGVQEQDIFITPREKADIFYVFDQEIPIPIDIKGYSASGELIYYTVPIIGPKHTIFY